MFPMKAERLLSILTILLSGKRVSARELAEELEVSVRTVYRDVDALAEAGIPVYATTGRDGGFGLVEGFRMTGQTLRTGEVSRVLSALDGLSGICPRNEIEDLKRKFALLLGESDRKGIPCPESRVFIELAPSSREKGTIDALNASIAGGTVVRAEYCDANGSRTTRDIEPLALVFYWQSWFVYAWCRLRSAFRCFRITRLASVTPTGLARTAPEADLSLRPWTLQWEEEPQEDVSFTVDAKARGRLAEYFDAECVEDRGDGRLLVRARFPVGDWFVSWLMGLPGAVSVAGPGHLRDRLLVHARETAAANSRKD